MIYKYLRVSTGKQDFERQEFKIDEYCRDNNIVVDATFEDKVSGKRFDRPQYQTLKDTVNKEDTVLIYEVDRLGRDWDMIKKEYNWFVTNEINLIIVDAPILNMSILDENGKIDLQKKLIKSQMFELYCYSAQCEREKISKRTKEALSAKKAQGVKLGRPKSEETQKTIDLIIKMHNEGCQTREIQFKTRKSRQYVCRIVKQYA